MTVCTAGGHLAWNIVIVSRSNIIYINVRPWDLFPPPLVWQQRASLACQTVFFSKTIKVLQELCTTMWKQVLQDSCECCRHHHTLSHHLCLSSTPDDTLSVRQVKEPPSILACRFSTLIEPESSFVRVISIFAKRYNLNLAIDHVWVLKHDEQ